MKSFEDSFRPTLPLPAAYSAPGPMVRLPILRWQVPLPGQITASSRSEAASPVLRGSRIYVGYSGTSALLVLDRDSGTVIQSLPMQGPVASAPIFANGFVFVADSAGYVACFNEGTGKEIWQRHVGAPVLSRPSLDHGILYVSNVNNEVYALHTDTGNALSDNEKLMWKYAHKVDSLRSTRLSLYGAPAPQLMGNELVSGFSDGTLVGLGAEDGNEHWHVSVGEGTWPDIIASPVKSGNLLVVGGYSGPLLGMTADTHSTVWRLPVGSASTPLVDGEVLYHGGVDGILRKIIVRTGEVVWEWKADIPGFSFALSDEKHAERTTSGTMGTPQLTPMGLLVGNSDGSLYLIDPGTGALRWQWDPEALMMGVLATPAVEGSEIYALSNAGLLYAWRGAETTAATEALPWVSPSQASFTR